MRATWLLLAALLASCDGDGSYGGPDGPATRWCQQQMASLRGSDASLGSPEGFCAGCCVQEVRYKGRIENGVCVCR